MPTNINPNPMNNKTLELNPSSPVSEIVSSPAGCSTVILIVLVNFGEGVSAASDESGVPWICSSVGVLSASAASVISGLAVDFSVGVLLAGGV
jgi:hypothetical protein